MRGERQKRKQKREERVRQQQKLHPTWRRSTFYILFLDGISTTAVFMFSLRSIIRMRLCARMSVYCVWCQGIKFVIYSEWNSDWIFQDESEWVEWNWKYVRTQVWPMTVETERCAICTIHKCQLKVSVQCTHESSRWWIQIDLLYENIPVFIYCSRHVIKLNVLDCKIFVWFVYLAIGNGNCLWNCKRKPLLCTYTVCPFASLIQANEKLLGVWQIDNRMVSLTWRNGFPLKYIPDK